jgi:hypothetical protein
VAKTVFNVLVDKVDEELRVYGETLISGAVKDYPAYRETCGVIRGLGITKRIIEEFSKKSEEDDNG